MTGICYTLQDSYYLPDLAIPAEGEQSIGIWGCGSSSATSAGGRSTDRAGRREAGRWWRPFSAGLRSASVGPGRVPPGHRTRAGRRDQRHRRYLKEHHRILYYNLLTACKLNGYLADIGRQAEELFSRLVKQMAECEGVTEALKA